MNEAGITSSELAAKLKGNFATSLKNAGLKPIALGVSIRKAGDSTETIQEAVFDALDVTPPDANFYKQVNVLRQIGKAPQVILSDKLVALAELKGLSRWNVSLTHDRGLVAALALGFASDSSVLGVGIDLTDKDRIRRMIERSDLSPRFIQKIFHLSVLREGQLAQRWSLKEATYKALPDPKPHFLYWQQRILVQKRRELIFLHSSVDEDNYCITSVISLNGLRKTRRERNERRYS